MLGLGDPDYERNCDPDHGCKSYVKMIDSEGMRCGGIVQRVSAGQEQRGCGGLQSASAALHIAETTLAKQSFSTVT
eukprot:3828986-Rhodomonas_salina.2